MGRPYDTGFICGRFNILHKGHQKLIDTGLLLCDRVLILVGSAQESGTERNPLDVTTRMKMIREIYDDPERVIVHSIADMTNENDIRPEWGKYLLNHVDRYLYKAPEIMIYGNDAARSQWFDTEDIKQTTELIVNRHELPISATMMRQLIALDLRKIWMKFVDPKLHKMYDELKNEIMQVDYYKMLAAKLTEILINNDFEGWKENVDPLLIPYWDVIRNEKRYV